MDIVINFKKKKKTIGKVSLFFLLVFSNGVYMMKVSQKKKNKCIGNSPVGIIILLRQLFKLCRGKHGVGYKL